MNKNRLYSTDEIKAEIQSLHKKNKNLSEEGKELKIDLDNLRNKFEDMYKESKALAEIQIKDKDQLNQRFTDVSTAMFKELEKVSKRCEFSENKVSNLKLDTQLTSNKLDEWNTYIEKLKNQLNAIRGDLASISASKAENTVVESNYTTLEEGIETLDRSTTIFDNRIK